MVKVSPIDETRIARAIGAIEDRTSAEIVCVLVRSASSYEYVPLVWSAVVALAVPAVLLPVTRWSAESIYLTQLGVFLATLALLSLPGLRMRLVPRPLMRRRAHRAAAEQFLLRGLARKADRTGVMIFVAETERYARIIADTGVASRVDPAVWRRSVDTLVAHARDGRLTDGFCEAIEQCGAILVAALPAIGPGRDELPDRVVVI